jgi:hypothetical protein
MIITLNNLLERWLYVIMDYKFFSSIFQLNKPKKERKLQPKNEELKLIVTQKVKN